MTNSRAIYLCLISFIAGIFINSYFPLGWIIMPALFIFGAGLLVVFGSSTKPRRALVYGLILISLFFGIFWHSYFNLRDVSTLAVGYNELDALIIEEPEVKTNTAHLKVRSSDGEKFLLITDKYFDGGYYDLISIKGDFHKPEPFEGFDYPGYLAKDGIYLLSFYPEIEVVGKENAFLFDKILSFKEESRKKIYRYFTEPHASILSALILGDNNSIPDSWQNRLSVSGVQHITSVSGLHITVLLMVIVSLGVGVGVNRKWSSVASIFIIFLFIAMIGGQPAAMRAGIMGIALVIAQLLGRMSDSNRIVVFVASIMLLMNPFLLKHDIGFQLSFMAVIGIINYSDFFKSLLKPLPGLMKETLATSFSAYLFTFPLISYYFGEVSLIFPLTNLLILPFVYWIMIFGIGLISLGSLGLIFVPLIWVPLIYLVNVVYFLSNFPGASIGVNFFSSLLIFIFIFLLIRNFDKIRETFMFSKFTKI